MPSIKNKILTRRLLQGAGVIVALAGIASLLPSPFGEVRKTRGSGMLLQGEQADTALRTAVDRACSNCHSNETKWPWYADVAPVSWIIRQHVIDGREHLNFSEWLKPGETKFTSWSDLEDICKAVQNNSMPLFGYDWVHSSAKLAPADRQAICAWVNSAIANAR